MAKNNGWFKMPRTLTECDLWKADLPFNVRDAYVDLLMMTNYEEHKFFPKHSTDVITIHEGEVATSFTHLAERWHWDRKKVMTYIDRLEKAEMLSRKSYNWGTVLTLAGHGILANDSNANETQTGQETGHRSTPQTKRKADTTKEIKKDKTVKKEKEIKKVATQPGIFSWEGEPE